MPATETFIPSKDASLESSIATLLGKLDAIDFHVEECSWLNEIENIWSVHVTDRDCTRLFSNGKGGSELAARASALGEFFERLSTNYFWTHFYLGEKIAENKFVHYPNEKWFPLKAQRGKNIKAWPKGILTPELQAFYNPDKAVRADQLIDLNSGNAARGICTIPYTRLRDGTVALSARFINDRHLPDKAIDVIDEAGAAQRILPKSKQKRVISKHEIEEIIAKIARVPAQSVSSTDRSKLQNLDRDLKAVVFGQEKAIDALAAAIKMSRSGLGNPQKPIGSFLFSGPTGVGKTEVARQLAYTMGVELIRFDMSEYMERHAVSRLIGAPPGYVGFDQGGLLTEQIAKHPYSVVLLDEIEKAHPDIFNILLQVMDHGTLTDNNGRKADFRNTVIVMTTNAGAAELSKTTMGFTQQRVAGDEMAEIKRMFTPEFRNRLDAIISFAALSHDIIVRVVDKFLMQLEEQLHEKKVEVEFTDALKTFLARNGFDPLMGARPMARLIQDTIRSALADELLFGKLAGGGSVTVDVDAEGKTKLLIHETKREAKDKEESVA